MISCAARPRHLHLCLISWIEFIVSLAQHTLDRSSWIKADAPRGGEAPRRKRIDANEREEQLKPSHVLITGNMGYIGPAVVRRLRASHPSARLDGLDTGYFAHCLTGAAALPERDLDVQHFVDVRRVTGDVLSGVDSVVHLAGISNDALGNAFEKTTHEINFEASVRFARLAKEAGVKSFVFASSCSVYGFAEGAPRAEQDQLNPLTAYARSKMAMEEALKVLASHDFVTTCLRFPTACGMSERLRLDLVLNDFVASAIATGRIDIQSSGTMWRPLIDTRDMALAIDWAVSRGPELGGSFLAVNVGRNDANFQLKDLANAVAEYIPGVEIRLNEDAAPDRRSFRVDFGLYQRLAPGHWPRYSIGDSIGALKRGLESMGFRDGDFRTSRYMRLRVLTGLQQAHLLNDRLEWLRGGALFGNPSDRALPEASEALLGEHATAAEHRAR